MSNTSNAKTAIDIIEQHIEKLYQDREFLKERLEELHTELTDLNHTIFSLEWATEASHAKAGNHVHAGSARVLTDAELASVALARAEYEAAKTQIADEAYYANLARNMNAKDLSWNNGDPIDGKLMNDACNNFAERYNRAWLDAATADQWDAAFYEEYLKLTGKPYDPAKVRKIAADIISKGRK